MSIGTLLEHASTTNFTLGAIAYLSGDEYGGHFPQRPPAVDQLLDVRNAFNRTMIQWTQG